jgi:hypothetical protein
MCLLEQAAPDQAQPGESRAVFVSDEAARASSSSTADAPFAAMAFASCRAPFPEARVAPIGPILILPLVHEKGTRENRPQRGAYDD